MKFGSTPTTTATTTGRSGVVASAGVTLTDTPRPHTAQPSAMARLDTAPGKRTSRPRSLYRRPGQAGQAGTRLMQSGWAGWITTPPSEATL